MGFLNAMGSLVKNTAMLPVAAAGDALDAITGQDNESLTAQRLEQLADEFGEEIEDDETL